eukprot:366260-Chlamydomonas_euryale.AAC.44
MRRARDRTARGRLRSTWRRERKRPGDGAASRRLRLRRGGRRCPAGRERGRRRRCQGSQPGVSVAGAMAGEADGELDGGRASLRRDGQPRRAQRRSASGGARYLRDRQRSSWLRDARVGQQTRVEVGRAGANAACVGRGVRRPAAALTSTPALRSHPQSTMKCVGTALKRESLS